MIVRQLFWISKSAKEAELLISDGEFECIAFSQPCDIKEGDHLKEPLHAFIVNNLMISRDENCSVVLIKDNGLAQKLVTKVVDVENGIVKIGNIEILLDEKAPPGVLAGDLVEFTCARLDIW